MNERSELSDEFIEFSRNAVGCDESFRVLVAEMDRIWVDISDLLNKIN